MRFAWLSWTLVLLGFAPACASETDVDESDELEVGSVEAPIINQPNVTNAHPEVGTDGCSAVLIRPNFILGASHCMPSGPDGYDNSGGWFTFKRANGTTFDVNWVESRNLILDGGFHYSNDFALIKLANPVSTSDVMPAQLANRRPNIGETVDVVGWGCINRTTQENPGGKRMYRGPYPTNVICPGDSGGGHFLSDGTLYGITATYDTQDRVGDVVGHRNEIEAQMRAMDNGLERGIDRGGNDFYDFNAGNLDACRNACTKESACHAFTFHISDGHCWLKRGVMKANFNNDAISGVPAKSIAGFDNSGFDITSYTSPSMDNCAEDCARRSDCNVWMYKSTNTRCYIKYATAGSLTPCAACNVGFRHGWELETDHPGGNLSQAAASSNQICSDRCSTTSGCITWTRTSDGTCWLKSHFTDGVYSPGSVANYRHGFEFFKDYPGNNLGSSIKLTNVNAETCQYRCRINSSCKAWT
ncbi:MAG TPA: PAN domain-containing protein, partial [Polyangiales bacterium]|nr:PAN domain-containing protein [Polyangiales bacterium]